MNTPCPLDKGHKRENFDCGKEALNRYLKSQARQSQDKNAARTFVICRNEQTGSSADVAVIGYCTLVFGSIDRLESVSLPEHLIRGLGKSHPVPILLLARWAVDERYQGQGVGATLLDFVIDITYKASLMGGLKGLVVDAKDEETYDKYIANGFTGLSRTQLRAFLPIDYIVKLKQPACMTSSV